MEKIIETLLELSNKRIESKEDFEIIKNLAVNISARAFGSDSKQVSQIEKIEYSLNSVMYIDDTKIGGGDNLEEITKLLKGVLISFANELKLFGKPLKKEVPEKSDISINVSQSQNQTQNQSIEISLILNIVKDELTGKQYKELETIIHSDIPEERKKQNIFKKLSSFGKDVLSNIVAGIITNPSVYSMF